MTDLDALDVAESAAREASIDALPEIAEAIAQLLFLVQARIELPQPSRLDGFYEQRLDEQCKKIRGLIAAARRQRDFGALLAEPQQYAAG